ncbi:RNA binding protein [Penicillium viridicatum]|nr:RNA binding protein [Penicillium viridicatum]
MARGNETASKIFYKGSSDDFIVFVDDLEILQKWKSDRSVPLTEVLNGWKIFVTHSHGAQGVLDTASQSALQNEFGTTKDDECMVKILEGGEYQASTAREREGGKNDSNGSR